MGSFSVANGTLFATQLVPASILEIGSIPRRPRHLIRPRSYSVYGGEEYAAGRAALGLRAPNKPEDRIDERRHTSEP
jgi:hypothetical protein